MPWSTNMQVSLSPIALLRSTAATEESTPPLRPRITLSSPSCSLRAATVVSINDAALHVHDAPQMPIAKLRSSCMPHVLWKTSGWNCTPHSRIPASPVNAAKRTSEVEAIVEKPSGREVMVSPWLIHTCAPASMPSNSGQAASTYARLARPYSRDGAGSTEPPYSRAVSCAP